MKLGRHVTAAAVPALAAAALLTAGAGAAPTAFGDPACDSGAAPDLTNVAVNDSAGSPSRPTQGAVARSSARPFER